MEVFLKPVFVHRFSSAWSIQFWKLNLFWIWLRVRIKKKTVQVFKPYSFSSWSIRRLKFSDVPQQCFFLLITAKKSLFIERETFIDMGKDFSSPILPPLQEMSQGQLKRDLKDRSKLAISPFSSSSRRAGELYCCRVFFYITNALCQSL